MVLLLFLVMNQLCFHAVQIQKFRKGCYSDSSMAQAIPRFSVSFYYQFLEMLLQRFSYVTAPVSCYESVMLDVVINKCLEMLLKGFVYGLGFACFFSFFLWISA